MTGKASRATFHVAELLGNVAPASGEDSLPSERRDAILDLDEDAFKVELQKYVERGETNGSYYSRLNSEGLRLVTERHERREKPLRDAWRPDDISEADQWPEPLRTVVAFRLLVGQYVAIAGNTFDSLRDHWKRSNLCGAFSPMADDVAAAMVATNEDPKGLYRALSLCNETDQMRFVDAWRSEILPTLKTVEIKLKNSTGGTATTNVETVSSELAAVEAKRQALRLAQAKKALVVEELVALMSPLGNLTETVRHQQPIANVSTHGGDVVADADTTDLLLNLKPSEHKAYLAHQYAERKLGRELKCPDAWAYLNEYGIEDDDSELSLYELPLLDTFSDYVSKARTKRGESKNKPRGGRSNGSRSIVKRSEV